MGAVHDPVFGELQWAPSGMWLGAIVVNGRSLPVQLNGGHHATEDDASAYERWHAMPGILAEHEAAIRRSTCVKVLEAAIDAGMIVDLTAEEFADALRLDSIWTFEDRAHLEYVAEILEDKLVIECNESLEPCYADVPYPLGMYVAL